MANKRKQKGRKQKKVFRVSEIIWALEQNGWIMAPMGGGDHRQFHKAGNPHVITVAGKLSQTSKIIPAYVFVTLLFDYRYRSVGKCMGLPYFAHFFTISAFLILFQN